MVGAGAGGTCRKGGRQGGASRAAPRSSPSLALASPPFSSSSSSRAPTITYVRMLPVHCWSDGPSPGRSRVRYCRASDLQGSLCYRFDLDSSVKCQPYTSPPCFQVSPCSSGWCSGCYDEEFTGVYLAVYYAVWLCLFCLRLGSIKEVAGDGLDMGVLCVSGRMFASCNGDVKEG